MRDEGDLFFGRVHAEPDDGATAELPGFGTSLRWLGRGAWAIADQGLFAASNFAINVALARWLPPPDYGAFTLAYTLFLLLATGHTALIVEPLLVFGAGQYRERLGDYLGVLLRGHWAFTVGAGVLLLLAGIIAIPAGRPELAAPLVAVAVATPLILLQWFMRRACYVRFEPNLAAHAGVLYLVLLFAGGAALDRQGWLTSATAMLLMGVGSLGSAVWIVARLRVRLFPRCGWEMLREVVSNHWSYGRWVIGSGVLAWIPSSIYYLLLPLRGGLENTAALKALMNVIMPVLHAYLALSVLMVPALVRVRGRPAFRHTVRLCLLFASVAAALYWVALGVLNQIVVSLLYKGQYVTYANLLWIIGLIPLIGAGVAVLGSALRALERPDRIFWAYALSTLVAVTVGVSLMFLLGVTGAAFGLLTSSFTTATAMWWFLREREPPQGWCERTPPRSHVSENGTLRIAHFTIGRCNPESANGLDKTVYHLSRAQAALGHAVAVFSITGKPAIPIPGVTVRTYPPRELPVSFLGHWAQDILVTRSPLNLPKRLVHDALAWQPDVLHLHFVHVPQNVILARQFRRARIPYCVTINGGLTHEALRRRRWLKSSFNVLLERRYLNRAAFLHVVSSEDEEGLGACGVDNTVVVAPNGIDLQDIPEEFDPSAVLALSPALVGQRIFTFVGRLDPQQKGLDLLLRGLAASGADNIALVIVGPDWRNNRGTLEALAGELGIESRVVFAGPAFGRRKSEILRASHVFAHPSRWEAGIPFSVLEAAALSKPCLLTRAADPTAALATRGAGITVEPTVESIAAGVRRFAQMERNELAEMGRRARQVVEADYSWQPIAQTLIAAYRTHALGRRG